MSEPYEFDALACYNAECARGLVHTPEYDAKMAAEQARFREQQEAEWRARGGREISNGCWILPGLPPKPRWWQRKQRVAMPQPFP